MKPERNGLMNPSPTNRESVVRSSNGGNWIHGIVEAGSRAPPMLRHSSRLMLVERAWLLGCLAVWRHGGGVAVAEIHREPGMRSINKNHVEVINRTQRHQENGEEFACHACVP